MGYQPQNIKVAVIDDSPIMREAVGGMLAALGFTQVSLYASGLFAAGDLAEDFTNLVICDFLMEPVNGLDVLKMFRTNKKPKLAAVPFILMSAVRDADMVAQSYFAGCTEFILKPFAPETLMARLKCALSRSDQFVLTDSRDGGEPGLSLEIAARIKARGQNAQAATPLDVEFLSDAEQVQEAHRHLKAIASTYLAELAGHLREMEQDLEWARNNVLDKECFKNLFVRTHYIKGTALMFEHDSIGRIADELSKLMRRGFKDPNYIQQNATALIHSIAAHVAAMKQAMGR
jgi:DNA-binding response OmpR family regulator